MTDTYTVTDYADAAATLLESYAKLIRSGASLQDLGPHVVLVGRLMAHKV
jgi:hypothetical protein